MTRFGLDRRARRLRGEGGPVVLGGSPLVMLRLTQAGGRLLDRLEAGEDLADLRPGSQAAALLDRLVDAGICHPRPTGGPNASEVTVIVPVRDRPDGLASTLAAIAATTPGVLEVIVIDDGSADANAHAQRRVVEAAIDTSGVPIRLVRRAANGGPAAARNTGTAEATTPVIAFVDAGCAPSPGWLDTLLPHLSDERIALVAPRITAKFEQFPSPGARTGPKFGRATAVERYEAVRSSLDLGPDPAPVRPRSKVPYVPSTAFVARAGALGDVGGFDEGLRVGEDVDLVWRLHEAGHRVRYEPAATVAHDHPSSLRRWAARRVDYGTSAAPLARRHPGTLAPLGISRWSAAILAVIATGHPLVGGTIAAGTAADLGRKFRDRKVADPWREAAMLAAKGHAGAGKLVARAALRAWLPVSVAAAVMSRRARRALAAAIVLPRLVEWYQGRPDLDPVRFIALAALDDAAYGLGVWQGVLTDRTLEPVVPTFTNWKA